MAFEPVYNERLAKERKRMEEEGKRKMWIRGASELISLATDIYIESKDDWVGSTEEDSRQLDLAQKSCVGAAALANRALRTVLDAGTVTPTAISDYSRAHGIIEEVSNLMNHLRDRVQHTGETGMSLVNTENEVRDGEEGDA